MALRSCTVSFRGPSGITHSVDVQAETLYEAAALGVSLLKKDGWTLGTLKGERHRDRYQLYVRVGSRKYIKDYHQTTFSRSSNDTSTFPQEGDIVAFRAESGHQLVPGRVWAVSFMFLHRP